MATWMLGLNMPERYSGSLDTGNFGGKVSAGSPRDWHPVWEAMDFRHPWRLKNVRDGRVLTNPDKYGSAEFTYRFKTADDAIKFLSSSKGRKAINRLESVG